MDLQQLHSFSHVCEHGNITKAAAALGVMPSVLSRHISAMEAGAGGKLFHRTGRGVVLTELGVRVLPRVLATLAEYRSLQEELNSKEGSISGQVKIGVVPSLANILAPRLFRNLRSSYPGIRLLVLEGSSEQLDNWRVGGLVDITLLFRAGSAGLIQEDRLAEVQAYLVGANGDKLTSSPDIHFSALAEVPLVLAPLPNPLRSDVDDVAKTLGFGLNIVLETNSLSVQSQLAAEGLAYTIVAGHALTQGPWLGLQATPIVAPVITRTIAIGASVHKPATAAVRLVAREIRRLVEESFASQNT